MPQILIDGVEYVPKGDPSEDRLQQGVQFACFMLASYMDRTTRDLLDEGTEDLVRIVKEEAERRAYELNR